MFGFGSEPPREYEDEELPEIFNLDQYQKGLQEADNDQKALYAWQVWKLTRNEGRFVSDLDKKGTLEKLLLLPAGFTTSLEVKRQTARALQGYTASEKGAGYSIRQLSLVPVLKDLMDTPDGFTKSHVLQVFTQVGSNDGLAAQLLESEVALEVLKCYKSEDKEVVENTSAALCSLCAVGSIRKQLFEAKMPETIIELLQNQSQIAPEDANVLGIQALFRLFVIICEDLDTLQELIQLGCVPLIRKIVLSKPPNPELLLTFIYMLKDIAATDTHRMVLNEHGMLKCLFDLMAEPTTPITGKADEMRRATVLSKTVISWCINTLIGEKFTADPPCCAILEDLGPPLLVNVLKWNIENLFPPILYTISQLTEDDQTAEKMIDLGGTLEAIRIVDATNPDAAGADAVLNYVTRILANIACTGRKGPHGIINNRGIEAICSIATLEHHRSNKKNEIWEETQMNCAAVLANCVSDDFGKASIVDIGALEVIVLQGDITIQPEEVVRTAMMALFSISEKEDLNLNLVEENALPAILAVIADDEYDLEAINYAKSALINFLHCGGHEALPDTLASSHALQITAGKALVSLAREEEYFELLTEPGTVWVLVAMATNGSVEEQEDAARVIAEMTATSKFRVPIAVHGGMEALVGLSSSNDEGVVCEVARAMRNLCQEPMIMAKLVQFGGIQLFAHFSVSSSVEIQNYTVQALANFCAHKENHRRLTDDGGFNALLVLMDHVEPEIQSTACRALKSLARAPEFQVPIVDGAMPIIFEVIMNGDVSCQTEAIGVLCGIAENPRFHDFLCEKEIPFAMLSLLKDQRRAVCHPEASQCLAILASCLRVQEMVLQDEVTAFVLSMLQVPNIDIHTNAAKLLAAVSSNLAGQEILADLGVLPEIVSFAKQQPRTSEAAYYGALTVANLIRAEDADTDVYEDFVRNHGEICEALVDPFKGDSACQFAIAKAINILVDSEYAEYKRIMKNPASTLRAVLLALENSPEPEVKRLVGLSLCQVLGDAATLRDTGPMLSMLASDDTEVVKIAKDALNKAELVPMGAVGDDGSLGRHDVDALVMKAANLMQVGDPERYKAASNIYRQLASQESCHSGLIEGGGLEHIIKLAVCGDDEVAVSAIFSCGGLSGNEEFQAFILDRGNLRQLLPLASNTNAQLQTYMASMLSNIAVLPGADITLAEEGFIEVLCDMMKSRNITILRQASRALVTLTHEIRYRETMRLAGLCSNLVRHVLTKDSRVYENVLKIMYDLVSEDAAISELGRAGGVKDVLTSVKGKGMKDQLLASRVICKLCGNSENQIECLDRDGMALVRLSAQSEDVVDQQHSGIAIAFMTTTDTIRKKFVQCAGVPVVVQLSLSETEAARVSAAKAFADLSLDDESHGLIVDSGGVDSLLAATSMSNQIGTRHAVRAVANLCRTDLLKTIIGESKHIAHFERYWRVDDLEISRYINLAMARLCSIPSNHKVMIDMWGGDKDGIEILLRVHLIHPDVYIRRCGILALSHLATNTEYQEELCESDVLHLLCVAQKRDGQDEEVKRCALRTLCSLMIKDETRVYFAEQEHMLEAVIANTVAARDSFPRLQEQSFAFLALIGSYDAVKIMMHEVRCVPSILRGLTHPNILVVGAACDCVAVAVMHKGMREELCQGDVIDTLMRMIPIAKTNPEVTFSIMRALANLAEDKQANEVITNHELRQNVVSLSQTGDERIRDYAIRCIGKMSEMCDVGLVLEALEQGCESSIALARYYGNVTHQQRAANKIAKLTTNPNNHDKVIQMGGIRELITLAFSSDEHVQRKTAMALADLAKVESSRVTMILEGALTPIVKSLMQSNFEPVREDARKCLQSLSAIKKACIHDLKIAEPLVESLNIRPYGMFVGGKEGASFHRWYRIQPVKQIKEPELTGPESQKGLEDAAIKKDSMTTEDEGKNAIMTATTHRDDIWSEVEGESGGGVMSVMTAQKPEEGPDTKLEEVLVPLSEERNYTPTADDVGFRLKYVWTPVDILGVRGESAVFVSAEPVASGPPCVRGVEVARVHPDDALLAGKGTYAGGEEGQSLFCWKRVFKSGRKEIIQGCFDRTYYPEKLDVGCRLIFGYIPVRSDGVRGNLVWSPPSDTVAKMPPSFRNFSITGVLQEGRTLYPDGKFLGGQEGDHEIQWFRKDPGDENWAPIGGESGIKRQYIPIQRDIGCNLRVRLKPENLQEERGKALFAETEAIDHGYPMMLNFRVSGGPFHTSLLLATGDYFGGFEGESIIQWYRSVFGGPYLPIKGATQIGYQPTIDDVSARVCCKYIPVRDDGRKGHMVEGKAVALGIDPKVQNLVSRMLIFGDAQFKIMYKGEDGGLEPRIFVMDRNGMKVQAGKTVVIPFCYDCDSGNNVSSDSDGTEIKASWSEDIRVVLHPTDVKTFMIIYDESDDTEDGLVKAEYVADSHKARDIVVLCIRSFCAFALQAYVAKKTRKKKKRNTEKEAIKKHRMAWLKGIQGRTTTPDTLIEVNEKHLGPKRIDDADEIIDDPKDLQDDDSDDGLTDRNPTGEDELGSKEDLGASPTASKSDNPLFDNGEVDDDPHQRNRKLILSADNKYANIDDILKQKGVGEHGRDYTGEHVDATSRAKAKISSKLSKVSAMLASRPGRVRPSLKDPAPKGQEPQGAMGAVPAMVPLPAASPPSISVGVIPSMGSGTTALALADSQSTARSEQSTARSEQSTARSVQDTARSDRSTGSTSSLSPAQKAMAGAAKLLKKKKKQDTNIPALAPGVEPAQHASVSAPAPAPAIVTQAEEEPPKKLVVVGDTLDRIKALANKNKNSEKSSAEAKNSAPIPAQVSTPPLPTLPVETPQTTLPERKQSSKQPPSLNTSNAPPDSNRSTASDRSQRSSADSPSSQSLALAGLKGSMLGNLRSKEKPKEVVVGVQARNAIDKTPEKAAPLSRQEKLQQFLAEKAAKRGGTEAATAQKKEKAPKPLNHVMQAISDAKKEAQTKKPENRLMLERKPPSKTKSKEMLGGFVAPVNDTAGFEFMIRGAFFVTPSGKEGDTATVKVSLSSNLDRLTWKCHTDRKEYTIFLVNIESIDRDATFRDGREQLAFDVHARDPETWNPIILKFEAISERVKLQWIEGLEQLRKSA